MSTYEQALSSLSNRVNHLETNTFEQLLVMHKELVTRVISLEILLNNVDVTLASHDARVGQLENANISAPTLPTMPPALGVYECPECNWRYAHVYKGTWTSPIFIKDNRKLTMDAYFAQRYNLTTLSWEQFTEQYSDCCRRLDYVTL